MRLWLHAAAVRLVGLRIHEYAEVAQRNELVQIHILAKVGVLAGFPVAYIVEGRDQSDQLGHELLFLG